MYVYTTSPLTWRSQWEINFFAYTLHDISLVDKQNVYEREREWEWALNIFFTEIIIIITTDDDDFVRLLAGWLLRTRRNLNTQLRYSLHSFCQLSFDVERRDVILEFILPSSRCCVIYVEKKKKRRKIIIKTDKTILGILFLCLLFSPKLGWVFMQFYVFELCTKLNLKMEQSGEHRINNNYKISCACFFDNDGDKNCTEEISWISKFSIKKCLRMAFFLLRKKCLTTFKEILAYILKVVLFCQCNCASNESNKPNF